MTRGHLQSFLVCFVPLGAVFAILAGFLIWDGTVLREQTIAENKRVALGKGISTLQERIDSVVSDLLILTESTHLEAISDGGAGIARLTDEFMLFTLRRGIYDQIRFLNTDGMETVRVNYASGVPFAVAPPNLQDKSTRPYFRMAQNAPRGTVYISGIDLNEEFGRIEKPIKPVIRMSSPVFDRTGARLGVVVVNLRAEPVLFDLVAPLSDGGLKPFVVDRDGNWILGGESGENWALDLTNTARVFADRYPRAWENMRIGLESFETEKGFFTVELLQATDIFLARHSTRSLSVIFGGDGQNDSRLNLYVGTYLPRDVLSTLLWPERRVILILSGAFIALMAIVSGLYAWARQRQVSTSFDAQLSQQVLHASKSSVLVTDENGIIAKVNPGFTAMTGYLPEEAIGQPLSFLRARPEEAEPLSDILMAARANGIWEGDVCNRRKSGSYYQANVVIRAITDPESSDVHFVELAVDILRQSESAPMLWRQANHDALTGLANRLLFEDRLEVACRHGDAQGHSVAVLVLNLDRFGQINDRYGHEIGDQVLRKVGDRIKRTVQSGDTVARLRADSFAVIHENVSSTEKADWIAQKITASIQRQMEFGGLSLTVGASMGMVVYPQESTNHDTLLTMAEDKMHDDKKSRKSAAIEQRYLNQ